MQLYLSLTPDLWGCDSRTIHNLSRKAIVSHIPLIRCISPRKKTFKRSHLPHIYVSGVSFEWLYYLNECTVSKAATEA